MTAREIAKLEQLHRDNPDGMTFAPLAEAHRRQGDPERALTLLHTGLSLHPTHAPGRIVLGRCHLDLGDEAAAESAFAAVLDHDPGNPIALQALADIAERQERYDESATWLESLLEVDPSNASARDQLMRVTAATDRGALAPVPLTVNEEWSDPENSAAADEAPTGGEEVEDHGQSAVEITVDEPDAAFEEWTPFDADQEVVELESPAATEEVDETVAPALENAGAFEPSDVTLDHPPDQAGETDANVIDWEPDGLPFEEAEPQEDETTGEPLAAVADAEAMAPVEERSDDTVTEAGDESRTFDEVDAVEDDVTIEPYAAVADALAMTPREDMEGAESPPEDEQSRAEPEWPAAVFGTDLPPFEEAAELAKPAAAPSPEGEEAVEPKPEPEPVATETMAELYLSQGHRQEALGIYRLLVAAQPENQRLKDKVRALEEEPVRPSLDPSLAETSAYSAEARGGQSITDFFRVLLDSRPEALPGTGAKLGAAAPAEPVPPAGPGAQGVTPAGEPTRPAQDRLSLSAIFGEDASPVPPAVPPRGGAAVGPKTGRFSFDAFFGAQRGAPPVPAETASASPGLNDEDLDDFQVWLQKLKG